MNYPIMRPAMAFGLAGALVGLASCGSGTNNNSAVSADRAFLADMPVVASVEVVNGDSVIVADLQATDKVYEISGSDLFDSVEIIRLDDSDEALVGNGRVWCTGDRFVIYSDGVVKQFDRSGKYLGNIGGRGQGPGEYAIAPYSIYIDREGSAIYMAPYAAESLMQYDLDGNYMADIPLAAKLEKSAIHVDTKSGRITAAAMPFEGSGCPNVYVQDFDGNILGSVTREGVNVPPEYSSEIYTSLCDDPTDFDYSFFNIKATPDSLYRYNDGKLTPVFTSNFREAGRQHLYTSFPGFFVAVTYGDPQPVSEYSYVIPNNIPFIVDRATLRGGFAKIVLDEYGMEFDDGFQRYDGSDYTIVQMHPESLRQKLSDCLDDPKGLSKDQKKRLEELRDGIDEEDNNYLIVAHWRKS